MIYSVGPAKIQIMTPQGAKTLGEYACLASTFRDDIMTGLALPSHLVKGNTYTMEGEVSGVINEFNLEYLTKLMDDMAKANLDKLINELDWSTIIRRFIPPGWDISILTQPHERQTKIHLTLRMGRKPVELLHTVSWEMLAGGGRIEVEHALYKIKAHTEQWTPRWFAFVSPIRHPDRMQLIEGNTSIPFSSNISCTVKVKRIEPWEPWHIERMLIATSAGGVTLFRLGDFGGDFDRGIGANVVDEDYMPPLSILDHSGEGFRAAIIGIRGDSVPRLIYADWLEERGMATAEDLAMLRNNGLPWGQWCQLAQHLASEAENDRLTNIN